MSIWFDDDEHRTSAFGFDEGNMIGRAIKGIRGMYGMTGAIALIAGLALLLAPGKTLVFLTIVLGAYFVIAGALHLITAIGIPVLPSGWRVLSVITSLLLVVGGVIMLRNQYASAATLATLVALACGFGWIIEGVMTILESELSPHRGLAIAGGLLSIIAGIVVFAFPIASIDMLILFVGAALTVFGLVLIVRAFQFGKAVR